MIKMRRLSSMSAEERALVMRRSEQDIADLLPLAQQVVAAIRERGDDAVVEYARKFDAPEFTAANLRVTAEQFKAAREAVPADVIAAIELAHDNIREFHEHQMPEPMWFTEVKPGIMAGEKVTPVTSVGLYVPRGKGAFPSVMLMLSVPAIVAGVKRVVVVTPPAPDGKPDPAALVAAEVAGVSEVYAVGGMQAIAALAYGTATLPRVDKVVGPGSSYVSAAKRLLYGTFDVGLPAGPSESIILADEHADPRLVALDLLVEAEHGPDSAALVVTHSEQVANAVLELLPGYIAELPEWRRAFVTKVLGSYGGVMLTNSLAESIAFTNEYAPEHLELLTAEPFVTLNRIENAGEILLGPMTPIPAANYALGLNAILPTGGFARTYSSVSVWDFLKRSGIGYLSRDGYDALREAVATLADYEDFPAHAMAIRKRNEIMGF
ncbi:MAG: histidinol dehydrogenase [Anaerolineae bacterium]|nr:histidinol dehydrogenase [Chloroflexota bacterium]MBW7878751.1 histidinol dehydrogenase [Anaerolineae bacterium]MDL1917463.1 histidinol dehydrogenase [Anaerolineae bacterium CFX4]OQY79451.1 MAG: histidinol dehydrogenase [Anaerolineae bacterium UTCFX5]MCO6444089.1 histidinol dehydrogenase [Anaerolineae bacterium]